MVDIDVTVRSGGQEGPPETLIRGLGRGMELAVERITPVMRNEMRTFLGDVARAMRSRHLRPYPGGTSPRGVSPGTLSRRSGKMLESIDRSVRVMTDRDGVVGFIGGDRVAAVHEFGATIRPTRTKYLTIPLDAALNPDGTPIRPSARLWEQTFVARSKNGNLLIFQRRGRNIVPLYLLVGPGERIQEVTITPRLGMAVELQQRSEAFAVSLLNAMMREIRRSGRNV